jgi:hypothetical protein
MKVCAKCKINKDASEYHKRHDRPCGVRSICKECYKHYPSPKKRSENYMRKYDLFKSYKITLDHYNNLLASQGSTCAICGSDKPSKSSNKKNFCVDHCHTTDKVRGLLCDSCNRAIGVQDHHHQQPLAPTDLQ